MFSFFCENFLSSYFFDLYISFFSRKLKPIAIGQRRNFFQIFEIFWNFFQKMVMIISFSLVWPFLTNVSAPSFVYDANRKRI